MKQLALAAMLAVTPAPRSEPNRCPAPKLSARHLGTAADAGIHFDGHLNEPVWLAAASSGAWPTRKSGAFTSPHTELRALWRADALVLGVFGADEDLRSADGVRFTVRRANGTTLRFEAPVFEGTMPDGVEQRVDPDGTRDDASDDDEEWAMELTLSWKALGYAAPPARVELNVERTDTPKGAAPRTVSWAPDCDGKPQLGSVVLERK